MYDPFAHVPHVSRESRTSAELQRLSTRYGYVVVDAVAFRRGIVAADVDHVVIDRYGIVLIDAEVFEGAFILGTDTDNRWTATHPDGRVQELRNPLYVSGGSENVARQVLADRGINLDATQLRSAIVFVGADISRLALVETSKFKVKTVEDIAELFEARYSSPPNKGELSQADVARITAVMTELSVADSGEMPAPVPAEGGSWSSDPAVVAANAVALSAPVPPMRAEGQTTAYRLPAELSGRNTGVSQGPGLRAALLTLGTIIVIVLTIVAGLLFFGDLQTGSPVAWTIAFVLLVAIAQLVASNLAAVRPRSIGRPAWWAVGAFILRVVVVGVFVGALWLLVAGGAADRLGASIAAQFEPPTQGATAPHNPPTNPGVVVAKRRLKTVRPDVYKSATDLNSPAIAPEPNARTSYTWTYVPAGASVPASFTLTIDASGQVVNP